MAYRDVELGLVARLHPAKAAERILGALRRCEGVHSRAAVELGVSRPTLDRWVERLHLKRAVERILRASVAGRGSKGASIALGKRAARKKRLH